MRILARVCRMAWLRSLAVALLAFVAAGPSCFTAMMWGDSEYGLMGSSRAPWFRSVSVGEAAAYTRIDTDPTLWLVLPTEAAAQLGVDLPLDARWLSLAPSEVLAEQQGFAGLLAAHRADPQSWPLRVVVVRGQGDVRWLLLAGQAAQNLPAHGDPDELRRALADASVDCLVQTEHPIDIDGQPRIDGTAAGVVELTRVDVWSGSSGLGRVAAKVLWTPVTLALDVVLLPVELVFVTMLVLAN